MSKALIFILWYPFCLQFKNIIRKRREILINVFAVLENLQGLLGEKITGLYILSWIPQNIFPIAYGNVKLNKFEIELIISPLSTPSSN